MTFDHEYDRMGVYFIDRVQEIWSCLVSLAAPTEMSWR
jgi:hypothetical protein